MKPMFVIARDYDFSSKDTIRRMNQDFSIYKNGGQTFFSEIDSNRYPERLDYEFFKWDSRIDDIDKRKTLEELLILIYDKYPLKTLSWILRKSQDQIIHKLKELKLRDYIGQESGNKSIEAYNKGSAQINGEQIKISVKQSDKHEIEVWMSNNNNYQEFDIDKVRLDKDIPYKEIFNSYIADNQMVMAFKFMIVFCNTFRMQYNINFEDDNVIFNMDIGKYKALDKPEVKLLTEMKLIKSKG